MDHFSFIDRFQWFLCIFTAFDFHWYFLTFVCARSYLVYHKCMYKRITNTLKVPSSLHVLVISASTESTLRSKDLAAASQHIASPTRHLRSTHVNQSWRINIQMRLLFSVCIESIIALMRKGRTTFLASWRIYIVYGCMSICLSV